jgi:SAM-dependent methyltransferase
MKTDNLHTETVESFGEEWESYDQRLVPEAELERYFDDYFSEFDWASLPEGAVGADIGCGSGRWARFAAPRLGHLHCVDASARALEVARRALRGAANTSFHLASVGALPFEDGSLDFAYSLGVLHHVPDTQAALAECVRKLKPGAPFVVYLYYALDGRPAWYRALWRTSDALRKRLSASPFRVRHAVADALALGVYLPLSRAARVAERLGVDAAHFPLASYSRSTLRTLRTDAYDRFATPLEQRFTQVQIADMMRAAGLDGIRFREGMPRWTAVGRRVA